MTDQRYGDKRRVVLVHGIEKYNGSSCGMETKRTGQHDGHRQTSSSFRRL